MSDHDVPLADEAVFVFGPYTESRQQHWQEWLCETREHRGSHVRVVLCQQDVPGSLFNRGLVLNCGVAVLEQEVDVRPMDRFVFWDVDLLPSAPLMRRMLHADSSAWPGTAVHWASGWTSRYAENYAGGCGGIFGLSAQAFRQVGGWPSRFWGWGGEDEAMQVRVRRAGYRIHRAPGPDVRVRDLEDMSLVEKLASLRDGGAKCARKRELVASDRCSAHDYIREIHHLLSSRSTTRSLALRRGPDYWRVRLE